MTREFRERLWPFMGGMDDHVHMMLSLPGSMTIWKAMQLITGGSSRWTHKTFPEIREFSWPDKCGAFTVSASQQDMVVEYIRGQEEHHRKTIFKEEFLALLTKRGVEYDERYLWV